MQKSIAPFCESYMFVLHPETGLDGAVETSVSPAREFEMVQAARLNMGELVSGAIRSLDSFG